MLFRSSTTWPRPVSGIRLAAPAQPFNSFAAWMPHSPSSRAIQRQARCSSHLFAVSLSRGFPSAFSTRSVRGKSSFTVSFTRRRIRRKFARSWSPRAMSRRRNHSPQRNDATGSARESSQQWTATFNPRKITPADFARSYESLLGVARRHESA